MNYKKIFICRSSPYNDVKKHNIKDKLNKTSPFLTGGSYEFFEKNPYFSNDHKSTYNYTISKPKFKGTPFVPPSTINHVSSISRTCIMLIQYSFCIFVNILNMFNIISSTHSWRNDKTGLV